MELKVVLIRGKVFMKKRSTEEKETIKKTCHRMQDGMASAVSGGKRVGVKIHLFGLFVLRRTNNSEQSWSSGNIDLHKVGGGGGET